MVYGFPRTRIVKFNNALDTGKKENMTDKVSQAIRTVTRNISDYSKTANDIVSELVFIMILTKRWKR